MTGPSPSYGKYDSNGSPKAMVLCAAANMRDQFDRALTRQLHAYVDRRIPAPVTRREQLARNAHIRHANLLGKILKAVRTRDMEGLGKLLDDRLTVWLAFEVARDRDVLNLTKEELLRTYGVHQQDGCPILADCLREPPAPKRIAPGATP